MNHDNDFFVTINVKDFSRVIMWYINKFAFSDYLQQKKTSEGKFYVSVIYYNDIEEKILKICMTTVKLFCSVHCHEKLMWVFGESYFENSSIFFAGIIQIYNFNFL